MGDVEDIRASIAAFEQRNLDVQKAMLREMREIKNSVLVAGVAAGLGTIIVLIVTVWLITHP